MIDGLPKGELVLLCDNSYLVEKVLYSNLRFDSSEIVHKSLIALADVNSFDSVLQLVSNIRSSGSAANWPIQILLGDKYYDFTFSGTSLHEHIVLSAFVELAEPEPLVSAPMVRSNGTESHGEPGKLASDDLVLLEEVRQLNKDLCSSVSKLETQDTDLNHSVEID